ncbi:MAG TPA: hypothetical protein PLO37_17770 [Candidatus Hydrogenedentes bacterium]|nr:hypothetical protein [Candidatus Hydrogenedentota bacterium]HPG68698.1 hypothetical protein [Candidatus Hydrogenedentota bacterium]
MKTIAKAVLCVFVGCAFWTTVPAFATGVPMMINHQGMVKVGGQPFTGTGAFRFAIIYNAPGGVQNKWTNDGSQIDTSNMPDSAVTLAVNDGLYAVNLGDSALGMMLLDGTPFEGDTLMSLRIWFDDGSHGPQLLTPDQPIATVPYAFHAQRADQATSVDHGSVYGYHIVNGEIAANKLADGATLTEIADDDGAGSGLDADSVDGLDSSAFMAATADEWVNESGDTMSGDLTVNGEVRADVLTYNAPRTHYYTVGGEDFVPTTNIDYFNGGGTGGAYLMISGQALMNAGVHLPHGAVVTQLKAFFYDNSSHNIKISMFCHVLSAGYYETMAQIISSETPGYANLTDSTIANPTIDNTAYSYKVSAWCDDSWDGANLRVKGAVIAYTISEAP